MSHSLKLVIKSDAKTVSTRTKAYKENEKKAGWHIFFVTENPEQSYQYYSYNSPLWLIVKAYAKKDMRVISITGNAVTLAK